VAQTARDWNANADADTNYNCECDVDSNVVDHAYSYSHRNGDTKADPDTAVSSNAACTPDAGASAMNTQR
jgi:hypothetical protein